jgi:hypothetical protein
MKMLVLLGVLFLVFAIGVASQSRPATPDTPATKAADEATDSKTKTEVEQEVWTLEGEQHLRASMRNPDSFSVVSEVLMANGWACYGYHAQNGFGGMNVDYAEMSPTGKFFTDDSRWNKVCVGKVSLSLK